MSAANQGRGATGLAAIWHHENRGERKYCHNPHSINRKDTDTPQPPKKCPGLIGKPPGKYHLPGSGSQVGVKHESGAKLHYPYSKRLDSVTEYQKRSPNYCGKKAKHYNDR